MENLNLDATLLAQFQAQLETDEQVLAVAVAHQANEENSRL